VAPGLRADEMPPLDAVVISHMHMDHLSNDTLRSLQWRTKLVVMPRGGSEYVTWLRACPRVELPTFRTLALDDAPDGLRITAVPVSHEGWRYGFDASAHPPSFTGYVIEYHGLSVYFPGDTAYSPADFDATRRRFPHLDLALLPIGPIHPRDFMRRTHVDPGEALDTFERLGARWMVPIHYDTLLNSLDARGEDLRVLRERLSERPALRDRVQILGIGEQRVLVPRKT
jgi:L-ascorbate metabolism protein UlaG (beta-lactamase superfamily)